MSHDPDVVKENETDKLIRRSASLRAVDDMLNRVCEAFQMPFVRLIWMFLRARIWLSRITRSGPPLSLYDPTIDHTGLTTDAL